MFDGSEQYVLEDEQRPLPASPGDSGGIAHSTGVTGRFGGYTDPLINSDWAPPAESVRYCLTTSLLCVGRASRGQSRVAQITALEPAEPSAYPDGCFRSMYQPGTVLLHEPVPARRQNTAHAGC